MSLHTRGRWPRGCLTTIASCSMRPLMTDAYLSLQVQRGDILGLHPQRRIQILQRWRQLPPLQRCARPQPQHHCLQPGGTAAGDGRQQSVAGVGTVLIHTWRNIMNICSIARLRMLTFLPAADVCYANQECEQIVTKTLP